MSMQQRNPISIEGMKKLEKELSDLREERNKAVEAVSEGRQHGDLRENAEYESAKNWQAQVESKISQKEQDIANSNPIDISKIKNNGTIGFGSTVTLIADDSEVKMTVQILGECEAEFSKNQISIKSPLAMALMGKKVNDVVYVKAPKGTKEYEIIAIK